LEQKHLHLLQIVESEKTAKWQYTQQCEELASEIKKLRAEVRPDIRLLWDTSFAASRKMKLLSYHDNTNEVNILLLDVSAW
jgi:hypothetical protein